MSNARVIYLWLRDSVVAVVLFLVACGFAGVVRSLISIEYPDFYMLWFTIGMFPLYWFSLRRHAISPLNRNDAITYAPVIVASAFIPQSIFEIHPILYALALYFIVLLAWQIRRFLPSGAS